MLTERQKKLLTIYLEAIDTYDLYKKRDKAMLYVMLKYELDPHEVAGLKIRNFKKNVLIAGDRKFDLGSDAQRILQMYLFERYWQNDRHLDDPLFTNYSGDKITPDQVKELVRDYLDLLERRK